MVVAGDWALAWFLTATPFSIMKAANLRGTLEMEALMGLEMKAAVSLMDSQERVSCGGIRMTKTLMGQ